MAFEEDIGTALAKACEFDSDNAAIHLAHAVRSQMFGKAKPFNGFPSGCQKDSVPSLLLALVNMILEGPSMKDQVEAMTSASLSIAQLLKSNSVKHERKQASTQSLTVRHSIDQETPVPTYIGLMMHAHTCKMDLVNRLYHLGMSISYDRVLRLSAQMGSNACKQFHQDHVVCPPKLKSRSLLQLLWITLITTPPQQHQSQLFMALEFPLYSIRTGMSCVSWVLHPPTPQVQLVPEFLRFLLLYPR